METSRRSGLAHLNAECLSRARRLHRLTSLAGSSSVALTERTEAPRTDAMVAPHLRAAAIRRGLSRTPPDARGSAPEQRRPIHQSFSRTTPGLHVALLRLADRRSVRAAHREHRARA